MEKIKTLADLKRKQEAFKSQVNLRDRASRAENLVQIKVALLVRGAANQALATLHTPLIEGAMFKVFAAASSEQLATVEGRTKLRSDAMASVSQALHEVTQQAVVEQVLFTGFVMQ